MNTIVTEHVAINDLPEAWRKRLSLAQVTKVRIVIEEEHDIAESPETENAFGMWRDRHDMDDVANHVRNLRAPRYQRA